MTKAKSKAVITVADGRGGMVPVQDRRFEEGWLLRFDVAKELADTWLEYLAAECQLRGWSSMSVGQLDASENSGSVTINTGGPENPQLAIVWERKRAGGIKVRYRPAGTPAFPLPDAQKFLDRVTEQCAARATERVYRRGQLSYTGLAWRGELWLDDALRLGPPTLQYEAALSGPRIILVDAMIDCIWGGDMPYVFEQKLRELSAFLSVAMSKSVLLPRQGQDWTFTTREDCAVRRLGYLEAENPQQMPIRGTGQAVPFKSVQRPDFSIRGIDVSKNEQEVPADIVELWAAYRSLSPDQRRQFLQAAPKWQEALMHWAERDTLSVALMVVACEALKPTSAEFRDHNIYDVVEALLGTSIAGRLQEQWLRPQDVRNAHLHRGEFRGSEFLRATMMSSYQDPTFDAARREFASITPATIIEWLRQGGTLTLAPLSGARQARSKRAAPSPPTAP